MANQMFVDLYQLTLTVIAYILYINRECNINQVSMAVR